jgi:hypothetical protein
MSAGAALPAERALEHNGTVPRALEEGRVYRISDCLGMLVGAVPAELAVRPDLHFIQDLDNADDADGAICYYPFCDDFGPYNIGAILRFNDIIGCQLRTNSSVRRLAVVVCSSDKRALTNAVFLLGAYLILEMRLHPDSPLMPLSHIRPSPFEDFRDATFEPVTFGLRLIEVWRALHKASSLQWLSFPSIHVTIQPSV